VKRVLVLLAALSALLIGCGEDQVQLPSQPVIEQPTQSPQVEFPEEIKIKQPVQVSEPVKVIVVNDPAAAQDFVAVVEYAGWAYGSSMGLFQFIVTGKMANNSDYDIKVTDVRIKINGRDVSVKKYVLPDLIPSKTAGWYFYVRTDDTVFYPKARYQITFRAERRGTGG